MTDGVRHRSALTRADIPFAVLALVTGVVLLYLGRSLTFFHDEWRSITFDGGLVDYLRPVNEHWSTLPLLLYRATFRVVELHSYLPYLAEVIVLHVLAVAGAYALMRARVGPLVATLFAVPLLLLGTGAENLFWAFQTGFVGSVTFGVWALFFVERNGRTAAVIASVLLVFALASSGMGLSFVVAVGARTILDPSLRSRVVTVAPPAAVYLSWYALFGHDAVGETGPLVVDDAAMRFAVRGVAFATEVVAGLDRVPEGYLWALVLFLVLVVASGWNIARGGERGSLALGCLLGLISMYTLIALVRANLEVDYTYTSRYVYVAGFFLVIAVVDLLPPRRAWPGVGRLPGLVVATVVGVGLLLSTAANVDALDYRRSQSQSQADLTRAFIALAQAHAGEPWVDPETGVGVMPPVPELLETISKHGSPLEDELVPGVVTRPSASAEEAALLLIVGSGFRVEHASGASARIPLVVVAEAGVESSRAGQCVRASARGAGASLTVAVPGGARVRLRSSSDVTGSVRLGHNRPPTRGIDVDLEPGVPQDVVLPDIGDGRGWQLSLDLAGSAPGVVLCAFQADEGRKW